MNIIEVGDFMIAHAEENTKIPRDVTSLITALTNRVLISGQGNTIQIPNFKEDTEATNYYYFSWNPRHNYKATLQPISEHFDCFFRVPLIDLLQQKRTFIKKKEWSDNTLDHI